jgi:hypothetical protein
MNVDVVVPSTTVLSSPRIFRRLVVTALAFWFTATRPISPTGRGNFVTAAAVDRRTVQFFSIFDLSARADRMQQSASRSTARGCTASYFCRNDSSSSYFWLVG